MKPWVKGSLQLLAAMLVALIGTYVLIFVALAYMAGIPVLRWPMAGGVVNTVDSSTVTLEIADKVFMIPRNHFLFKEGGTGGKKESVSLRALLPDFEPYTEANRAEFEKLGWHRKITMGLVGRPPHMSVAMDRDTVYQRIIEGHKIKSLPAAYGLTRRQLLPRYPGNRELYELYTARKRNGRLYWVSCSHEKSVPSPSCDTTFQYAPHIHVDYSFAKNRLADWQAIDDGVMKLITQFEVQP